MVKEGKAYTEEYNTLLQKWQEKLVERKEKVLEYAKAHPTLVGLYLLKNQLVSFAQEDYHSYLEVYRTIFADKFPDSELTVFMQNWVNSRQLKLGSKFIDFTAPDLKGTTYMLSEEISGKVALIDLWASWCGPCRSKSKSMIPVYEAYKDKGFTVVGVARERDASSMEAAVEQDKYPWLNLLELNDKGKIWEKYGVGNGGGAVFLVGKDGKILAIDPTAEEVKKILEEVL